MTEKKSKGKGALVSAVVIAAIAGGTGYAAYKGLIPGLESKSQKAMESLKKDIAAMKGNGIEEKLAGLAKNALENDKYSSSEDRGMMSQFLAEITNSGDLSFNYTKLEEVELEGRDAVKIVAPEVSLNVPNEGISGKAKGGWYTVARDADNPNHYFYKGPGSVQIFGDIAGTEQKIVELRYEPSVSEMITNDDFEVEYAKGEAKNLEVIEGRGGTVLLRMAEMKSEQSIKTEGDQVDAFVKAEYSGIEPGDMIKMMIGAIEPLSLTVDASYKGDEMGKVAKIQQDMMEGMSKAMEQVGDQSAEEVVVAKPKTFAGELGVNDLSLMMGDAGIKTKADLSFANSPLPIPKGSAQLVLAKYQKLIETITRFVPAPPDELERGLSFLKAIGEEQGEDIVFNFAFDGTENVLIGGKTMQEIDAIGNSIMGGGASVDPYPIEEGELLQDGGQNPYVSPEVQSYEIPSE